jgi:hypothetical protein
MMKKRYRIKGYGRDIYSNLKDAIRAYQPKMPFNAWGFIRRTSIFVPARRPAELPDPGQSDDEAEGFEREPAQVEDRSEPQMDQTLTSATLVDESSENQLDGGAGDVAADHSMTGDEDDDQASETENPVQEGLDGIEMKTSLNFSALSQDVVDKNWTKIWGMTKQIEEKPPSRIWSMKKSPLRIWRLEKPLQMILMSIRMLKPSTRSAWRDLRALFRISKRSRSF